MSVSGNTGWELHNATSWKSVSQLGDCCSWNHGILRHKSHVCQCLAVGQLNLKAWFVMSSGHLSEYWWWITTWHMRPEKTLQGHQILRLFSSCTLDYFHLSTKHFLERMHSVSFMNKLAQVRELVKRLYMFLFFLYHQCMAAVVKASRGSDDCELAAQQKGATAPEHNNDACPKATVPDRLKVDLAKLLHTQQPPCRKCFNVYVCVCVPEAVDMLLRLPVRAVWHLEITRGEIYNCLFAWTWVSWVWR